MASAAQLREYLERIHATNVVSCNVPQVLDSLDITVSSVPSINLYLFELIQNALDARADSIEIQLRQPSPEDVTTPRETSSSAVFLHNGPGGLGTTDTHVRGMSNVFQSTKSVGSVGFMGFGFKTLYKRFSKVSVSDNVGWKFQFAVPEELVNLQGRGSPVPGSTQSETETIELKSRGWIGAVCPTWNDEIVAPPAPFTTRFEMTSLVSTTLSHPINEDISEALFSGDMIALAVLATQGLKSLKIEDKRGDETVVRLFTLSYVAEKDGLVTVIQSSPTTEKHSFRSLCSSFKPNNAATRALAQARLKNILQHHKNVDRVIDDIRKTYRALGLVGIDNEGAPVVQRGQLFATLPIRSFVPFGMSIQADWLLDLSRKGLRDVETNPWQQLIVQQIAKLIADWLVDIPSRCNGSLDLIKRYFAIFGCDPDVGGYASTYAFSLKSFGKFIAAELGDAAVIPVIGAEPNKPIEWMSVDKVVVLPKTHYRPKRASKLIGAGVVDESLMTSEACAFFVNVGLIKVLDISDVIAKFSRDDGIGEWFNSLDKSESSRRESLVELWAFLAEFAPAASISQLKCIPSVPIRAVANQASTKSSPSSPWSWTSPVLLSVFEHATQYRELPEDLLAQKFLQPSIPEDTLVLPPTFLQFLLKQSGDWNGPGRVAFEWIAKYWTKRSFKLIARRSFMNTLIPRAELEPQAISSTLSSLDRFSSANQQAAPTSESTTDLTTLGSVLAFTRWAVSNQLSEIITHIIPSTSWQPSSTNSVASSNAMDVSTSETFSAPLKLIETQLSVLGAPFVDSSLALIHTRLFSGWAPIHSVYGSISLPGASDSITTWASAFSSLGAKGPVVLEEYVLKELTVYPSYTESRKVVADLLEISHDSVADFQTTSRKGWKVNDTRFKDAQLSRRPDMWPLVAHWLESHVEALERGDAMLVGQGEVWRIYTANGRIGTATWCKELNEIAWVPMVGKEAKVRPFEAAREHVSLSPQLIRVLEKRGVFFGRTGAQKLVLDQIATFNAASFEDASSLDEALANLTKTLQQLAFVDSQQQMLVSRALETSILPTISGQRIFASYNRLVRSNGEDVSTLGGFLTPTSVLPESLASAMHELDDRGIITIPRWPTPSQAAQYFNFISDDINTAARNVAILPEMFDCLSADQAELRSILRRNRQSLKMPSNTAEPWLPISEQAPTAFSKEMCGTIPRVQQLVLAELRRNALAQE